MSKEVLYKGKQVIKGKVTGKIGNITEVTLDSGKIMLLDAGDVTEVTVELEEAKETVKAPESTKKARNTKKTT